MPYLILMICVMFQVTYSCGAAAEIYRWQDASGAWHFGDQVPLRKTQSAKLVTFKGERSAAQRLGTLKKQVGNVIAKRVAHGRYQQYIPEGGLDAFKIFVVNHGMFASDETALDSARNTLKKWVRFADEHKVIIVAPAFDNHNYAATVPGARNGGYRGLYGRHVGADEFLHEILREYTLANPGYDGRFYLSGHSAGAQFANRYLVRHPERVIAAAFSAPAWLAQPDDAHNWPYGMGRRQFMVSWPGENRRKKVDIRPAPRGWLLATQRPVAIVVGERDLKKIRHVPGIGGDTHVDRARHWVAAMNQYAENLGREGRVELILVPDVGHNYGRLARVCQKFLSGYLL